MKLFLIFLLSFSASKLVVGEETTGDVSHGFVEDLSCWEIKSRIFHQTANALAAHKRAAAAFHAGDKKTLRIEGENSEAWIDDAANWATVFESICKK